MSDDRAILESLVARVKADAPPANEHEQADLLAAYEANALSEAEVEVVERWLAQDSGLRSAWLTLREGAADAALSERAAPAWRRPLLVAAVLLAAFGTWRWIEKQGTATTPSMEDRLTKRVAALRAGEAPWLQPLRSLSDTSQPRQERPVYRDGLRVLAPRGKQLQGRPTFRFSAPPGTTDLTLRVEAEESGAVLLVSPVSGSPFPWPSEKAALSAESRYVWILSARTTTGVVDATLPFDVASVEQGARMTALLRLLAETGDDADRLLAVVVAYDHGFVDEAMRLGAQLPEMLQTSTFAQRMRTRILEQGAPGELWPR